MNILTALAFFFGLFLVGLMPFPILYGFSNILRFVLQKVFGYRRKVIVDNLTKAFPEMTPSELKKLEKKVYKNIADIFLEGIKAFMMTREQILKRHKVINPEVLEPYLKDNQSILGVTGHYANWEWGSLSASTQIDATPIAFYKRLSNSYIDKFVRKSRMKFGTILANITETASTFEKHVGQKSIFLMAADQNTIKRNLEISYWINFFGREIPFLHGPEKYAKMYNLPVFYIDIQRIRRGCYELELSLLVENPSTLPEGEITNRYARKLEEIIRKKPEDWLWSHRRWKLAR
jgi:Kdo2-lipid IVA lauroyltransferase/acyltransferase